MVGPGGLTPFVAARFVKPARCLLNCLSLEGFRFLRRPFKRQMEHEGQEPITGDPGDYAAVVEASIGRIYRNHVDRKKWM